MTFFGVFCDDCLESLERLFSFLSSSLQASFFLFSSSSSSPSSDMIYKCMLFVHKSISLLYKKIPHSQFMFGVDNFLNFLNGGWKTLHPCKQNQEVVFSSTLRTSAWLSDAARWTVLESWSWRCFFAEFYPNALIQTLHGDFN